MYIPMHNQWHFFLFSHSLSRWCIISNGLYWICYCCSAFWNYFISTCLSVKLWSSTYFRKVLSFHVFPPPPFPDISSRLLFFFINFHVPPHPKLEGATKVCHVLSNCKLGRLRLALDYKKEAIKCLTQATLMMLYVLRHLVNNSVTLNEHLQPQYEWHLVLS